MISSFRSLYRWRELLIVWSLRDIRVRYKQSLLGAAWAILQPLTLMLIFTFVFSVIANVPSDGIPYPIFSYTALLPWTFLATSISFGSSSLTNNMNLVTKVYFPREILPMAAIIASFVDFTIATAVYLILILYYRVPIHITVLAVPLLLFIQIILTIGVVCLLAAANVFYRDIRFIVPLGLQLWLFATPIIYPLSIVPENIRPLYMLNPMAGLIEAYRAVMLKGVWPQWQYVGSAALISVLLFILGISFFKRVEWQFADLI